MPSVITGTQDWLDKTGWASRTVLVTSILLSFVSWHTWASPVTTAPVASSAAATAQLPSFTALVKKEGPAVVNISTLQKIRFKHPSVPGLDGLSPDDPFYDFFRRFMPREFRSQSLGSGFIISQDGYILTNAHVVEGADDVTVRLTDTREFKAKIIGSDRRSDVALLKIPARDLPTVSIGDPSKLEVGEWVVAIGSPFGFSNSVSQGIVSAKGRSLPGEDIVPFIQTDVPINPGNSGGPLFNLNGEVIGINSQIYSQSGGYMGLSFAIPIDIAMSVKAALLEHGAVRRGWLGVHSQDVSPEQAESFFREKNGGARIASVEKDGPADQAGLKIGDIILKVDGKEVTGAEDLIRTIAGTAPGSMVKLQVWRRSAGKQMTVTLGDESVEHEAKRPRQEEPEQGQLGLALRELSRAERRQLQTDGSIEVEGVNEIAEESGIQPGDIIIAVNSQRVSNIKQLREALAKADGRASLLIQRGNTTIFIRLKLKSE